MDGALSLWDRRWPATPVRSLAGHVNAFTRLAPTLHRDGRWLAAGGSDGHVRLWDTWASSALPGSSSSSADPCWQTRTALPRPAKHLWVTTGVGRMGTGQPSLLAAHDAGTTWFDMMRPEQ